MKLTLAYKFRTTISRPVVYFCSTWEEILTQEYTKTLHCQYDEMSQ